MSAPAIITLIVLIAAVVAANIWSRRHSARLSKHERRAENDELDRETRTW